jgi:hypothetical protein
MSAVTIMIITVVRRCIFVSSGKEINPLSTVDVTPTSSVPYGREAIFLIPGEGWRTINPLTNVDVTST